ncbi:hypothetical protein DFJ74DRAFT_694502 [Hyaloraphidium curvatum]|nr:hypothetical protein DFJ74DRAFT_694502 [Hyaloraphidium curvatum]
MRWLPDANLLTFMLASRACYELGLPYLLAHVAFDYSRKTFPSFAAGYSPPSARERLRYVKKISLDPAASGSLEVLRGCVSLESLDVLVRRDVQHAPFSENELATVSLFWEALESLGKLRQLKISSEEDEAPSVVERAVGKSLPHSLMKLFKTASGLESWSMLYSFTYDGGMVDFSPFPELACKLLWMRMTPAQHFVLGTPSSMRFREPCVA